MTMSVLQVTWGKDLIMALPMHASLANAMLVRVTAWKPKEVASEWEPLCHMWVLLVGSSGDDFGKNQRSQSSRLHVVVLSGQGSGVRWTGG